MEGSELTLPLSGPGVLKPDLMYSTTGLSTLGIGALTGPVSHLAGEYGTLIFPVPCQVYF